MFVLAGNRARSRGSSLARPRAPAPGGLRAGTVWRTRPPSKLAMLASSSGVSPDSGSRSCSSSATFRGSRRASSDSRGCCSSSSRSVRSIGSSMRPQCPLESGRKCKGQPAATPAQTINRRDSLRVLLRLRFIDALNMHCRDVRCAALWRDFRYGPQQPALAHRVPNKRKGTPGEVVLEVAVGEADDKRSGGYRAPRRSLASGVP